MTFLFDNKFEKRKGSNHLLKFTAKKQQQKILTFSNAIEWLREMEWFKS